MILTKKRITVSTTRNQQKRFLQVIEMTSLREDLKGSQKRKWTTRSKRK